MKRLLPLAPVVLAAVVLAVGCTGRPTAEIPAPGPPWFEDVTDQLGIDFVHDPGPISDKYFMPQIVGSGAALIDFDGDGLLDLYLINNGGPTGKKNRLYKQRPDGTFQDVSAGSGLDVAGFGMGAAVGDVNRDGRPDLLLTEYGRIRLFLNLGGGKFKDISEEAGLKNPLWATSAAFVDYNRDGWLDLFVTNYIAFDPSWPCIRSSGQPEYCDPKTFKGTASKLFRNRGGERGTPRGSARFLDVSLDSGVALAPPGLGVACLDLTGDGWPDFFVANDGAANHLWVNNKAGRFQEEAVRRGCAYNMMGKAEANMGIGLGDVDGDGLFDLFVTHLDIETNTVWRQKTATPGYFEDWTTTSGMNRPAWRGTGFGTVLADFDNDGAIDAAVANGSIMRQPEKPGSPLGPYWSRYGERNQLFANDGTGRFRDLSPSNPGFSGRENVGRGLAVGDLRNDGGLWLVVTSIGDRARVFRNVAPNRGHWLGVRALTTNSRRDALGAEVSVFAGGRRWVRMAHTGGSFLCSNDPRCHFGLGGVGRVERIEVRWPHGGREEFPGGAVDRYVSLVQGEGKRLP